MVRALSPFTANAQAMVITCDNLYNQYTVKCFNVGLTMVMCSFVGLGLGDFEGLICRMFSAGFCFLVEQ